LTFGVLVQHLSGSIFFVFLFFSSARLGGQVEVIGGDFYVIISWWEFIGAMMHISGINRLVQTDLYHDN
jgi:hypothetical protein